MTSPRPVCFISYCRHDNDAFDQIVECLAEALQKRLESEGVKVEVFLDKRRIIWGDDFWKKILDYMARTVAFVPVFTDQWIRSKNCVWEFEKFMELFGLKSGDEKLPPEDSGRILPLILAAHDQILHPAPAPQGNWIIRTFAQAEHRDLQDALPSGRASSWDTLIKDFTWDTLIKDFISVIKKTAEAVNLNQRIIPTSFFDISGQPIHDDPSASTWGDLVSQRMTTLGLAAPTRDWLQTLPAQINPEASGIKELLDTLMTQDPAAASPTAEQWFKGFVSEIQSSERGEPR
jgi:hypothetical protein